MNKKRKVFSYLTLLRDQNKNLKYNAKKYTLIYI